MFSLLHRAHRRRRYERASSWNYGEDNSTVNETATPPTTPENQKVEGFHFCSSNQRLGSSLNDSGNRKKVPTRQLSMPTNLEKKNIVSEDLKDLKQTEQIEKTTSNISTNVPNLASVK